MPFESKRLRDNKSSAGDNTTRSDSATVKRQKLLSAHCHEGYDKGGNTNREGGKKSSHPFDHLIQKALAMPSTSESSAKRPADRGIVIASRLKPEDPTMVNRLEGGTLEEAQEYYNNLPEWKQEELNNARRGNGSNVGEFYLLTYNELKDKKPEKTDDEKHDELINVKSITNRVYEANRSKNAPKYNKTFIENYKIIAKYSQYPSNVDVAYKSLENLQNALNNREFNDWEVKSCQLMGIL